jgi:hypothetical protein
MILNLLKGYLQKSRIIEGSELKLVEILSSDTKSYEVEDTNQPFRRLNRY